MNGVSLKRATIAKHNFAKDGDFAKKSDFSVVGDLVGEANFLEDTFATSNLSQDWQAEDILPRDTYARLALWGQ
jgi:hypothetical protein